jgi:hypothetical protein
MNGRHSKRIELFEEYIERTVQERMKSEIYAILEALDRGLEPEEFRKVARILSEAYGESK